MFKHIKLLLIVAISIVTFSCDMMEKKNYTSIQNDPLKTEIYTLENGLKVFISRNPDKPRITTRIAVRAGSKYDPADATGLAHYLEHMLFKGTSKIASLNWEKEKVILQQISDAYEERRNTEDETKRKMIYKRIDSLSNEAAKYVAANEYDKMISSLGAQGTNAYTWLEQTVYVNDIPSTEFEKWVKIEAERFSELVLRLFHTELETVYEEFNRTQDNDYRKLSYKSYALLFPNHQYGTQTTIGKGEHLKNPSMVKIHEYFDTYYVPNNVAIILAGDVPENADGIIEKYFGDWKSKEVPGYTPPKEEPIAEVAEEEVFGPMQEMMRISYRVGANGTDDADKLLLVDYLLNNGSAGIIDLDLIQKQKVLSAYSSYSGFKDHGIFSLSGTPLKGQSLEEVKELLLEQLEKIKSGNYEDWMLDAIINDFKKSELQQLESNRYRASLLTDLYIMEEDLEHHVKRFDRLRAITKQDLMNFAKETFKENNYVVVYKRTGNDPNIHKVEKPEITPVQLNRDTASAFAQSLEEMPEKRLDPVFIDFKKELYQETINEGLDYFYIQNKDNELFQLTYVFEMGRFHDAWLPTAVNYLDFLGTDKYTNEEFKKELFKLGLDFSVYAGTERAYVTLSGLSENLEKGASLFEHLLSNAVVDQEAYDKYIASVEKTREDAKKNKWLIHGMVMMDYAKYGAKNPFNSELNLAELRNKNPQELVDKVKSLSGFEHLVFYYGPASSDDAKTVINKHHNIPEKLAKIPAKRKFEALEMKENLVYFTDYDMVQAELAMVSRDDKYSEKLTPHRGLFNNYFGSGLSSIVFQEIRESKALAYSSYAFFSSPGDPEGYHYVRGYIGTQADKLADAVDALKQLLSDMPKAKDQFKDSKKSALKSYETSRITKASIFWNYLNLKRKGINYDIRKDHYEGIKQTSLEDLDAFFKDHVAGKNYTYLVIGKRDNINFDALKKLGKVKELSKEELFGY